MSGNREESDGARLTKTYSELSLSNAYRLLSALRGNEGHAPNWVCET